MTDFVSAFNKGQNAAERARKNKEEIRAVIEAVNRALSKATDDVLCFYLNETPVSAKPWAAAFLSLSAAQARGLPSETWLYARNTRIEGSRGIQLARFQEGHEGYPVTVRYNDMELRCGDKRSLEGSLSEFLADAWVGEKLAKLLSDTPTPLYHAGGVGGTGT